MIIVAVANPLPTADTQFSSYLTEFISAKDNIHFYIKISVSYSLRRMHTVNRSDTIHIIFGARKLFVLVYDIVRNFSVL